jgi:hypothetical protein
VTFVAGSVTFGPSPRAPIEDIVEIAGKSGDLPEVPLFAVCENRFDPPSQDGDAAFGQTLVSVAQHRYSVTLKPHCRRRWYRAAFAMPSRSSTVNAVRRRGRLARSHTCCRTPQRYFTDKSAPGYFTEGPPGSVGINWREAVRFNSSR